MQQTKRTLGLPAVILAAALLAIAVALVSQYGFNAQPCPWCVLQRLLYALIAIVAALGLPRPMRRYRIVVGGLVLILALLGIAAAAWQHFVAARSNSCDLTLAYRIVGMDLHLDQLLPGVFEARATCADAAVNLLGIPYDFWSLGLFAVIAGVAIQCLRKPGSI
ncbi:MAG TPA: disulfide bond formation protein B [Steroidobacteraceae bacterium]|jgi:disulfide bond formation protein DsbB|nr:disulfide bond formation protein B [Steroidobacteraceae bacterium]